MRISDTRLNWTPGRTLAAPKNVVKIPPLIRRRRHGIDGLPGLAADAALVALKGVRSRPLDAAAVLRRHVWLYGVGGIVIPFPGIKLVDMVLVALGLV